MLLIETQHLLFHIQNLQAFQWKETLNLVTGTFATIAELRRKDNIQNGSEGINQIQQSI